MKKTVPAAGTAARGAQAAARPRRGLVNRNETSEATVAGVTITHADRLVYAEAGITKRMVAAYYERVAPRLLPYIAGRPLSIVRCPEGAQAPCFFQKHVGEHAIAGIEVVQIKDSGGRNPYLVANSATALVGLAQINALELHVWGAKAARIERPDTMVFDLDPDPGLSWPTVVAGATRTRDLLDTLGIAALVKTTGGKGVHLVVPLESRHSWDEVKDFAQSVALHLAQAWPEQFTASLSKARRRGKIFVDYLRNTRGATVVAPYSLRARALATVATPLAWNELNAQTPPGAFTLESVLERVARKKDPWADYEQRRRRLTTAMRRALR